MRIPKPWFRKQNKTWYVTLDGVQHKLGHDSEKAKEAYKKLLDSNKSANQTDKVRAILKLYWAWVERHKATSTASRRKPILESFGKFIGESQRVSTLKPFHLDQWIEKHYPKASNTYQHTLMTVIGGAMSWAAKKGYISANPLTGMEKPTPSVRQEFLPSVVWTDLLNAARDQYLKDFLVFMLSTGARPQEMFKIEAHNYQDGKVVFSIESSKGKKRSRVIYLPDDAREIIERLIKEYPTGRLFRNSRGNPWTKNAIKDRLKPIKKKLGLSKLNSTMLRHSFAHHRLTSGQDSMVVSKLMGHVDSRMLETRYGHLDQNSQFMQEEADRLSQNLVPKPSEPQPENPDGVAPRTDERPAA